MKSLAICVSFAAVSMHAQTAALQSPCTITPQTNPGNAVVITTAPNIDFGGQITGAVAQAIANGSNTVIVNSGGSPAPMTTPVTLNSLSNVTIQMSSNTSIYGYGLTQPMFTISGGSNLKILGGHLSAGTPGLNAPYCIRISGTDANPVNTVELAGFECGGTTSHGISITGSGSSYQNVQNVSIHNTLLHDTGSVNILATGVNNICMQSNVLVNPGTTGINGTGDPSNAAVSFSENVYFGLNYVAGTPIWFRQPNPSNTPPSGFYSYSSTNVNTDSNTFVNSQCTPSTCSSTTNLPSSLSAIHMDTVANSYNVNNVVDDYSIGITCELSWNCTVQNATITNVYNYGLYDESNYSEQSMNPLTSTASLIAGTGVTLQTVQDVVNGASQPVVQATMPTNGIVFTQNFGSNINYGVMPFPEIWVKSANGQPSTGLQLWFSPDANIFDAHTKVTLPALVPGQWTRVALQPAHLSLMGIRGVQTWGLVNPGNHASDVISVSDYRQIADSRNNVYNNVNISATGAYPLDVSGCGSNTTFNNITITNPGSVGVFPYYNSGLIGQVFIGGYNYCTRTGVAFNNTALNLNVPYASGGSALFNLSNYGSYNTISNVVLNHSTVAGPYSAGPTQFVTNNQGSYSTIASPTVIP